MVKLNSSPQKHFIGLFGTLGLAALRLLICVYTKCGYEIEIVIVLNVTKIWQ